MSNWTEDTLMLQRYEDQEKRAECVARFLRVIVPFKPLDVLEVGSGFGCLAAKLQKEYNVHAVEPNAEDVNYRSENYKGVYIHGHRLQETRFAHEKFDLVLCVLPPSLHDREMDAFFTTLRSSMKPAGRFISIASVEFQARGFKVENSYEINQMKVIVWTL
jgi:SAM-dependent methyltransferase